MALRRMLPELRRKSLPHISRMKPLRMLAPGPERTAAASAERGLAGREPAPAGRRCLMEREKEIAKLVNVLRRTARMALQSEWTGGSPDVAVFCTDQYNRVLARLKEMDPSVAAVFDPLAPGSSLTVAAM